MLERMEIIVICIELPHFSYLLEHYLVKKIIPGTNQHDASFYKRKNVSDLELFVVYFFD